jgi:hypothetical protein
VINTAPACVATPSKAAKALAATVFKTILIF